MAGTPGTKFGATFGAMRVADGMPAVDALTSAGVRASSRLFTGSTNQIFLLGVVTKAPRYLSRLTVPPGRRAESPILTSPSQRMKNNRKPCVARTLLSATSPPEREIRRDRLTGPAPVPGSGSSTPHTPGSEYLASPHHSENGTAESPWESS